MLQEIKNKILDSKDLIAVLENLKMKGKKIVFTNGCFDLLHKGHIDYLSKARELGDVLILGLNTDNSIKRIKGETRPIQDEDSRAFILASLVCVDYVVMFEEDTPYNLINAIKPDVLVKGADYKKEDIVGGDIVEKNGGEVTTIEFLDGYSTTNIIKKIKAE
ncbi:MAG: D-glycero-beta-D-manno-heptose 1-phosphate adenylyltransferase [Bacteroidales bacterium]|nr:D-glycero-beta-D-manno-heptose 1-phosphate adenylyltransferase [Bacteroidales bacterium]